MFFSPSFSAGVMRKLKDVPLTERPKGYENALAVVEDVLKAQEGRLASLSHTVCCPQNPSLRLIATGLEESKSSLWYCMGFNGEFIVACTSDVGMKAFPSGKFDTLNKRENQINIGADGLITIVSNSGMPLFNGYIGNCAFHADDTHYVGKVTVPPLNDIWGLGFEIKFPKSNTTVSKDHPLNADTTHVSAPVPRPAGA